MEPDPLHPSKAAFAEAGAGEVDVWWGGYAGRTMVPWLVVCALLTAAFALAAWLLARSGFSSSAIRYGFYVVTGTTWLIGVCLGAYRCVAVTYRLTNHRLYLDRGFYRSAFHVIDLRSVTRVEVEQGLWDRWLGIGSLRISLAAQASHVYVTGLREPARLAKEIRRARRRLGEVG